MQKLKELLGKLDYNAPVVLTFVLASGVALLLDALTGGWANEALFSVYAFSPTDPLGYVRLFGHVLGHANLQHYAANMMLLLLVGPSLEEKYGSLRLALMVAATALVTGLVHILFVPGTALLGASGVVFMLIVLGSVAGAKEGTIPLTLVLVAVFFLGQEVVGGLFSADDVSQLTHIVGGLMGGAFGFLFAKRSAR